MEKKNRNWFMLRRSCYVNSVHCSGDEGRLFPRISLTFCIQIRSQVPRFSSLTALGLRTKDGTSFPGVKLS